MSNQREIDLAYGALCEGIHITGYTFERSCAPLLFLLQEGRWRRCGSGFDDVDAFVASVPARLADRFVRQLGLTWFDVIFISQRWQHMAKVCRERMPELSSREADFIATISRSRRMPTDKQLAWLTAIYERLRGAA